MKNLVILANKYPNLIEPNVNVFTQQVAWALLDNEINITVICPNPLNYCKDNKLLPYYSIESNESGKKLEIYRPRYFGLGQDRNFMQKLCVDITTKMYIKAVDSVLKKMCLDDTVILAEFICPSGVAASLLGKKYNINSYMQVGEATYQGDKKYGNIKLKKKL